MPQRHPVVLGPIFLRGPCIVLEHGHDVLGHVEQRRVPDRCDAPALECPKFQPRYVAVGPIGLRGRARGGRRAVAARRKQPVWDQGVGVPIAVHLLYQPGKPSAVHVSGALVSRRGRRGRTPKATRWSWRDDRGEHEGLAPEKNDDSYRVAENAGPADLSASREHPAEHAALFRASVGLASFHSISSSQTPNLPFRPFRSDG